MYADTLFDGHFAASTALSGEPIIIDSFAGGGGGVGRGELQPSGARAGKGGGMTVYFCWERANYGDWTPVCYHGEKPRPVQTTEGDPAYRSTIHEVPDQFISADGTPNFGRLAKRFPAPRGEA